MCAFQGLLPLLLHSGLLPPTLDGDFLRPVASPPGPTASPPERDDSLPQPLRLRFPTGHLVAAFYLPIFSHTLTLSQILQLVLARSPLTHRWFGFASAAVLFIAITVPLDAMAVLKERAMRDAERLLEVGQTFATRTPPPPPSRGTNAEEGEAEDWICSICLAGQADHSAGVIGFDTPCRLPCTHTCTSSITRTRSAFPHEGGPSKARVVPVLIPSGHSASMNRSYTAASSSCLDYPTCSPRPLPRNVVLDRLFLSDLPPPRCATDSIGSGPHGLCHDDCPRHDLTRPRSRRHDDSLFHHFRRR